MKTNMTAVANVTGSNIETTTVASAIVMNTNDLSHKKVRMSAPRKNDPDNTKKVGRIHAFVFHPRRAQLVGYLIKRPDVALMFRRDDMFVAFDGLEDIDGTLVVKDDPAFAGRTATKALKKTEGITLDDCIIWFGLPVITPDGVTLGVAENVEFDAQTGQVLFLELGQGATANTLLGRRRVPASMIRGFKRGQGARLYLTDDDDPESLGALVVDDAALSLEAEGGVAEKAGTATAVATDKAKRTYKKVVRKASDVSRKAEPKVKEATKAAGEAVQKGVFATGRQIARTEGMFSNFKKEFQRALNDDGEDTSANRSVSTVSEKSAAKSVAIKKDAKDGE